MSELPEKIVRYDVLRVEYGKAKMCRCDDPHYEIDHQNRLVYCRDCGAIVDPFEALEHIARDTQRWTEYTEQLAEQRRQIADYHPRRVILKALEKQYIRAEHDGLEPTCPRCGRAFELKELLDGRWVNRAFAARMEGDTE